MLRTADLPAIRFRDLRHAAATLLLSQGVDPRTIMETLGHSQISLTMNTYSHDALFDFSMNSGEPGGSSMFGEPNGRSQLA